MRSEGLCTSRIDIHKPFRLCTDYPDIPGSLGFVVPGHTLRLGSPMVASTQNADGVTAMTMAPDLRYAKIEDVGIVHRVVITCGIEGFVLTNHSCYSPGSLDPN